MRQCKGVVERETGDETIPLVGDAKGFHIFISEPQPDSIVHLPDADFEASFYIIRHTVMPAVLTENFMMDNVDDAAFLLSEKGKTAIIKTHIDGINRYLIAYNELFKVLF